MGLLRDADDQSNALHLPTQKRGKSKGKSTTIAPSFVAVGEKKSDLSARTDRQTRRRLLYISKVFCQSQSTVIITSLDEFCAKYNIVVPDNFLLPEEMEVKS